MSAALPEIVDAWRMVQAGRRFEGSVPLARLKRLGADLATTRGEVAYDLEFGRDELGVAYLRMQARADLPLTCQRTLDEFDLPVRIDARLGLITREEDEAGLPPGYEPLLTADGAVRPLDVIEDELILALPVVPVKPGSGPVERSWGEGEQEQEQPATESPFAALKKIKASRR